MTVNRNRPLYGLGAPFPQTSQPIRVPESRKPSPVEAVRDYFFLENLPYGAYEMAKFATLGTREDEDFDFDRAFKRWPEFEDRKWLFSGVKNDAQFDFVAKGVKYREEAERSLSNLNLFEQFLYSIIGIAPGPEVAIPAGTLHRQAARGLPLFASTASMGAIAGTLSESVLQQSQPERTYIDAASGIILSTAASLIFAGLPTHIARSIKAKRAKKQLDDIAKGIVPKNLEELPGVTSLHKSGGPIAHEVDELRKSATEHPSKIMQEWWRIGNTDPRFRPKKAKKGEKSDQEEFDIDSPLTDEESELVAGPGPSEGDGFAGIAGQERGPALVKYDRAFIDLAVTNDSFLKTVRTYGLFMGDAGMIRQSQANSGLASFREQGMENRVGYIDGLFAEALQEIDTAYVNYVSEGQKTFSRHGPRLSTARIKAGLDAKKDPGKLSFSEFEKAAFRGARDGLPDDAHPQVKAAAASIRRGLDKTRDEIVSAKMPIPETPKGDKNYAFRRFDLEELARREPEFVELLSEYMAGTEAKAINDYRQDLLRKSKEIKRLKKLYGDDPSEIDKAYRKELKVLEALNKQLEKDVDLLDAVNRLKNEYNIRFPRQFERQLETPERLEEIADILEKHDAEELTRLLGVDEKARASKGILHDLNLMQREAFFDAIENFENAAKSEADAREVLNKVGEAGRKWELKQEGIRLKSRLRVLGHRYVKAIEAVMEQGAGRRASIQRGISETKKDIEESEFASFDRDYLEPLVKDQQAALRAFESNLELAASVDRQVDALKGEIHENFVRYKDWAIRANEEANAPVRIKMSSVYIDEAPTKADFKIERGDPLSALSGETPDEIRASHVFATIREMLEDTVEAHKVGDRLGWEVPNESLLIKDLTSTDEVLGISRINNLLATLADDTQTPLVRVLVDFINEIRKAEGVVRIESEHSDPSLFTRDYALPASAYAKIPQVVETIGGMKKRRDDLVHRTHTRMVRRLLRKNLSVEGKKFMSKMADFEATSAQELREIGDSQEEFVKKLDEIVTGLNEAYRSEGGKDFIANYAKSKEGDYLRKGEGREIKVEKEKIDFFEAKPLIDKIDKLPHWIVRRWLREALNEALDAGASIQKAVSKASTIIGASDEIRKINLGWKEITSDTPSFIRESAFATNLKIAMRQYEDAGGIRTPPEATIASREADSLGEVSGFSAWLRARGYKGTAEKEGFTDEEINKIIREGMSDKAIRGKTTGDAQRTYNHIMSDGSTGLPGYRPDFIDEGSGHAVERTLDVPSSELESFLITDDLRGGFLAYSNSIAPQIEFHNRFGHSSPERMFREVSEEFAGIKRGLSERYAKEIEAVSRDEGRVNFLIDERNKKFEALTKRYKREVAALRSIYERQFGIRGLWEGNQKALPLATQTLSAANSVALMGNVLISSAPDPGRIIVKGGLSRTITNGFRPFIEQLVSDTDMAKAFRENEFDARISGAALELTFGPRIKALTEANTIRPLAEGKYSHRLSAIQGHFFNLTGLPLWNQMNKLVLTSVIESKIIGSLDVAVESSRTKKAIKGKVGIPFTSRKARPSSDKAGAYLASLGLSGKDAYVTHRLIKEANKINPQIGESVVESGGTFTSSYRYWDKAGENLGLDPQEVREVGRRFLAVLRREVSNGITTPQPTNRAQWTDVHPMVKLMLQFRGFFTASTSGAQRAALQQADLDVALGWLFMLGAGAASFYIRLVLEGKDPSNIELDQWMDEAIDRSGLLAGAQLGKDVLSTIPGVRPYITFSGKQQTRRGGGDLFYTFLGPSASTIRTGANAIEGMLPPSAGGVRAIRRLMFGQNLFYLKRGVDAIEAITIESLFDDPKQKKKKRSEEVPIIPRL